MINPSQITFNQLRDIAEKLGVNKLLDMDSLYEECCRLQISPLQISGRSTLDKWEQIFKNFPNQLSNIYCILSFVFSIPVTNAFCERVFSIMDFHWGEDRARASTELIKSEIQVKINFKETCQEFYKFCLSRKHLLVKARSGDKYE